MFAPCQVSTRMRAVQPSFRPQNRFLQPRVRAIQVAAFNPPTVSDTKLNFRTNYDKPISAMYETVIQELLVQQHFMRYNTKYKYDPVFALGIVSVFDQILDDLEVTERDAIFKAYITCFDEDAATYRKDAEELADLAEECKTAEDLVPSAEGSKLQQQLAEVAARTASGDFFYTRFFAIGVFRLLELTDTRDPKALEGLVKGLGVDQDSVNKDLLLYKSILSKMSAAKELMKEFLEREKKKQAEREAEKAAKEEAAAVQEVSTEATASSNTADSIPEAEKAEAKA